jgi:hypothetical protein
MVVATTALFLALGGTGYAAFSLPKNSVGTKQLRSGAVTTKKIKNGAVTAAKINTTGLTVPNALHANSATTAGSATNASHATAADSATKALSPVGYAHVNADGTVDASQSSGVTNANVTKEFTSTYCFRGLPFTFKTALVSGENQAGGTSANDGFASVRIPSSICAGGAQAQVFTTSTAVNPPAFAPLSFYIWFFN